jgi:hypothetical protein
LIKEGEIEAAKKNTPMKIRKETKNKKKELSKYIALASSKKKHLNYTNLVQF